LRTEVTVRKELFMQSRTLKISAVVLGAIVAFSASSANAIPMGPIPTGGGHKLLSAIPMGPIPTGTGHKLLSAIPMGPIPTGGGHKLLSAIPMGPIPTGGGGRLVA
jgi:hypothetical protein